MKLLSVLSLCLVYGENYSILSPSVEFILEENLHRSFFVHSEFCGVGV